MIFSNSSGAESTSLLLFGGRQRDHTLLRKCQEALAGFTLRYIQVLLPNPAKEADSLVQNRVALQIVCCHWMRRGIHHRCKCATWKAMHQHEVGYTPRETYYVYSLFITSFSIASMALSNSAAVCDLHGSICFILSAMNWCNELRSVPKRCCLRGTYA